MGNKRHSKSVIVTILVTVIVLAVLSVIGIRYLMPYYAAQQNTDTDMQYTIYRFAVRLFPLLVGIVLIVIASMIAGNKDDDVDEDDLLPPNSYDDQLFETPSDDPKPNRQISQKSKVDRDQEPAEETVESDGISDDDFFNIFNDSDDEQPVAESDSAEDISSVPEVEDSFEDDSPEPFVEEDVVSDVQMLPVAADDSVSEPNAKEEPAAEPVSESPSTDNKLVEAIYALVNKLDDMTDLITYEEEDDDVEDDVEEEEPDEVEPVVNNPASADYSSLERKIDKLCDSMARLIEVVSSNAVVAAAPVVAAPEKVETPVAVPEEVSEEIPVGERQINDFDANDPIHLMQIEFDSAQEDQYDISFVFTPSSAEKVNLSISEVADAFEVNGNTVIVIPFLSKEEALSELDKGDIKYSETIFVAAGEKADFKSLIASRLA